MSSTLAWVVMPFRSNWPMTEQAALDVLAQTGVEPRLLLIDTGCTREVRSEIERFQLAHERSVYVWHHQPSLPSLSATWNAGLRFCWAQGAGEALVVNNDVRLPPPLYFALSAVGRELGALFISAVGRREQDYVHDRDLATIYAEMGLRSSQDLTTGIHDCSVPKGGPDFSCFLISREAHEKYPFDEAFIPAYCEDCSTHREYMLGGDGPRIFSVNLPYLHYASGTVNSVSSEERSKLLEAITKGSRAHYMRKWGGQVNYERYLRAFDPTSAQEGATNPDLQRMVQAEEPFPWEALNQSNTQMDARSAPGFLPQADAAAAFRLTLADDAAIGPDQADSNW